MVAPPLTLDVARVSGSRADKASGVAAPSNKEKN
jgi:hypothetical protein